MCRSFNQMQDGLKAVIITCICFSISVTVALVITIAVLPPQVSFLQLYFFNISHLYIFITLVRVAN